ncbi:MAG: amidohydrolase family protein [Candidatus Jordarchaeum sp.]|uniref:amidohydrolase family protein n=1 Tax=Candidatus Jordarchaeum sp. TaxID=2823881 RepID=UPI00404A4B91
MIIDTHSQLWNEEAFKAMPEHMKAGYLAIFGSDFAGPKLEDEIKDMDEARVDKAVIVAIDAETVWGYKVSNELVAEAVDQYPDRLIGFAGVDPRKGVLAVRELERAVKELDLKGLKLLPHLLEINPNDKIMYPVYEKAQELEIPVLLHTGTQFHSGTRIKYCQPLYVDDVAVDFPNLKLVIAHFGFPWFYEAIAVCQRNPNVYINLAGWAPKHIPEPVITYINGPLRNKALFGSDYPLLSRKRIVEELKQLPFKNGILEKIFDENPKRFLGIN